MTRNLVRITDRSRSSASGTRIIGEVNLIDVRVTLALVVDLRWGKLFDQRDRRLCHLHMQMYGELSYCSNEPSVYSSILS